MPTAESRRREQQPHRDSVSIPIDMADQGTHYVST